MSLAGLAAAAAILAAVLAMARFLSGPRKPVATATRVTGKRSVASPASRRASSGSENAAASLTATSTKPRTCRSTTHGAQAGTRDQGGKSEWQGTTCRDGRIRR